MKGERLDEAIAALRETTSDSSADSLATEQAILRRMAGRKFGAWSRPSAIRWGVLIALGSSTVWAVTGPIRIWVETQALPASRIPSAPSAPSAPTVAKWADHEGTKANQPLPEPASALSPDPLTVPETAAQAVVSASTPAEPKSSRPPSELEPRTVPEGDVPLDTPSLSDELRLYRAAYDAHFKGTPNVRTLAFWDRYLTVYPRGTFAPEARFNRALCLLVLGRKAEARLELKGFAEGQGYRRREAEALLGTLESEASPPVQ